MATISLRYLGDPVLKQQASEVTDIDGRLVDVVEDMFVVLDQARGAALAAPQVGIQKQLFVYEYDDEPGVLINPVIKESADEWTYTEGCLSIPGIYFEIVRPKQVLVTGIDLDGNDVVFEADEFQARLFQHEIDHLHGRLMIEHLTEPQAKAAKKHLLELRLNGPRRGAPIVTVGRDGLPLDED